MKLDDIESKRILRNTSIQLIIWMVITALVVAAALFAITRYMFTAQTQHYRMNTKKTVELARNMIEPVVDQVRTGDLDQTEGLIQTSDILRRLVYTDIYGQNYIFLVGDNGDMWVNPYSAEREGTNLWEAQDKTGQFYIQSIIQTALTNPKGGFVRYYYPHPITKIEEEKISFVIRIPELKAVIGTGLYLNDFTRDQQRFTWIVAIISIMILGIFSVPISVSIRKIREFNKKMLVEMGDRKNAEENLSTIYRNSQDGILVFTPDGCIIATNPSVCGMFGISRDSLLNMTLDELSDRIGVDSSLLSTLIADNKSNELREWTFNRISDQTSVVTETSVSETIWNGLNSYVAIIRDITNRKKIEAQIARDNFLLEKAQKMAHVGHFYINNETDEVVWSKEMFEIVGLSLTEKVPPLEIQEGQIGQPVWHELLDAIRQSRNTGEHISLEFQFENKQRIQKDVSINIEPIKDEKSGKIVAIAGAVQDVTERKRAENALQLSETRFLTAIENIPYEIWAIDQDGRYVIQNKVSKQHWGDVIGKLAEETDIPRKFSQRWINNHKRVLQGETITYEYTREVNGVNSDLFLMLTPIYMGNKVTGGFGLNIDLTEQKNAQRRVQAELEKINILREIDKRIIQHMNMTDTLDFVARKIKELLNLDAVAIHLLNITDDRLEPTASSGIKLANLTCPNLVKKKSLCWEVIHNNQMLTNKDPKYQELVGNCPCIKSGDYKTYIGLPIHAESGNRGVIEVYKKEEIQFDEDWMDFLVTLVGQAAIVMDNALLFSNLEEKNRELITAYEATIAGWSQALELRDKETKGHSDRVLKLATELAIRTGIPDEQMEDFRRGVFLHDIGKMGIPDSILLKPGPLSDDEWIIMKQHPKYAYDLLSEVDYLKPALDIPYSHHERWNGSGYPQGLQGEEIPLAARIFAVVDVWDALISDRPYRPGWDEKEVKNYLRENEGVLFDPVIVEIYLNMMKELHLLKR